MKHDGSYIGSPDCIKTKTATINHINDVNFKMPFKYTKILELNQHKKSDKSPSIILKYYPQQRGKYIPCRYSMPTTWAFDSIENKHNVCRGEGFMKKFC